MTSKGDTLFPIPDSRFPIPDSRFPIPDSRFPIPQSPIPNPSFHPIVGITNSARRSPSGQRAVIVFSRV